MMYHHLRRRVGVRRIELFLVVFFCLWSPLNALALVNFDEGQRQVKGVQLLQDASDPKAYYYVPQFPRLSTKDDGTFEFLCLKYVDAAGGTNGGLFHALVEFSLPEDAVASLEKELQKEVPGGRVVGPVPLMQANQDGEEGMGSFQIVSAVLSNEGEKGPAGTVVTSGKAPLVPGSKAVVAAILNQQAATLLWESFTGPTSDVSVAIHAYYEAAVKGYNARVTADVSTIYTHFSKLSNWQKDYSRRQVRKVIDDLQRNGTLKIEVLDRTAGLGISAKDMEGILQVVTDKLTELMFDHKTGWAADPQREAAVEQNQIMGRQKRGWFDRVFGGTKDTKYYTDDQFVLKRREDIKRNVFNITLSKSSTIKVPVDTAGNLGGLYQALGAEEQYFRIVNLDDPAFEFRRVYFQVDGSFLDAFKDTLNAVSVNVRKNYPDNPAFTHALMFSYADIQAGKTIQEVAFPRLGMSGADWTQYEYQIRWSLRDGPTISVPANPDQWLKSQDAAVSLVPPFTKRIVEIDADRQLFQNGGIATAVVEFATTLAGRDIRQGKATLRVKDSESTSKLAVYHDREAPVVYRVSWFASTGAKRGKLQLLDTDYLFLVPPQPDSEGGQPQ